MRLKAKLKSSKLNRKLYSDLSNIAKRVKAGYPTENPQTHQRDTNGFSAFDKAYAINFTDKNFLPYLQISFNNNKLNYQKKYKYIAKLKPNKQAKELDKLGLKMQKDIQHTISNIQHSPTSNNAGCIHGSVSYKVSK